MGASEVADLTALIVDDSLTVRMDLAAAFESSGFAAVCCATASEARAILGSRDIDIVILDVILPDGSGPDLLREIRSNSARHLPVLMLSSEAEVRDRIVGLAAGADEYVGKPYDAAYIISKSRALLRARHTSPAPAPILLVDDSLTSRQQLGTALKAQGFRVIATTSAEDALMLASSEMPAAIIVDSLLPGMDGPTLIRRTKLDAALRLVPCILLTAASDAGAELRALDAGADVFVRKDEDTSVVLAKLRALLRRAPELGRELQLASLAAGKKILAVDNSVKFREELVDALRGEGYDVIQARNGEEAIELVAIQPVDCVLLDMDMPGLSGEETCRRLKESPVARDIPVLLLTALEDSQAVLAGLASGADDFIQKSAGFEVLKARLRAQLRRRQIEDETRKVRERLLQSEHEAAQARASHELAETRARLVEELQRKNQELEELARAKVQLAEGVQRAHVELENAYRELQATQAKLIQSAKMASLGELVAGVAHEINNPLAFVISHLATVVDRLNKLRPGLDPSATGHWELAKTRANEMNDGLARIKELVLKLRTFSRLDEGEYKAISMQECVDAVLTIQQHRFGERITASTHIEQPDIVSCYPSLISQAVMNLVSNAIDAITGEGAIRIFAGDRGSCYEIAVEDTGTGIPMDLRERVIEPFFTTKPVGSGTGLGLAITYSIVQKHGGTFELKDAEGGGTRAVIRFPRRTADAGAE